ncbi:MULTISPECIES: hypothetical protein [unclassified Paraflavitalea]|uniref:hypothetical protein n=1 Tax=unclassified Paraflavitalea TaxID=2798305 RepID=UPI003D33DE37
MGFSASLIFIKAGNQPVTDKKVLDALWQVGWDYTGDASFEEAMFADEDKTYIAYFNDTIVIGTQEIPLYFLNDGITGSEEYLIEQFGDAEIAGVTLQSSVNHWGYGIIQNKQKIRAYGGNYQAPVLIDHGNPLPEEMGLLENRIIKEDGAVYYIIDGQEYSADAIGEELVFDLVQRYTGYALNDVNNPLDTLVFKRFEKNKYYDSNTKAEIAGDLTLSDELYDRLEPEQYGYQKIKLTQPDGSLADIKKYIQTALANGAINPAIVFQLKPLVVVAYAYDIDCVVPLLFPEGYEPPIAIEKGQRLLSINMYGKNGGELEQDLIEGKNSTGSWKTFAPHIADFYSTETAVIEEKKKEIEEQYWERIPVLIQEYFKVNPNRKRLGLNAYSGFALNYSRPTPPPSKKPWWKFWG